MAPEPKLGKPAYYSPGPRARRLFSYIGFLARGWAAYVGHVAPLGDATGLQNWFLWLAWGIFAVLQSLRCCCVVELMLLSCFIALLAELLCCLAGGSPTRSTSVQGRRIPKGKCLFGVILGRC